MFVFYFDNFFDVGHMRRKLWSAKFSRVCVYLACDVGVPWLNATIRESTVREPEPTEVQLLAGTFVEVEQEEPAPRVRRGRPPRTRGLNARGSAAEAAPDQAADGDDWEGEVAVGLPADEERHAEAEAEAGAGEGIVVNAVIGAAGVRGSEQRLVGEEEAAGLVGRRVEKVWNQQGSRNLYEGEVTEYFGGGDVECLFHVVYDDLDSEDLHIDELEKILLPPDEPEHVEECGTGQRRRKPSSKAAAAAE
jgi:hypothetical protein